MSNHIAAFARGSSPTVAAIAGVIGAVGGGGIYLSVSGILVGLLVALGMCGLLAMLAAIATRTIGLEASTPARPAVAAMPTPQPLSGPLPAAAAGGHAMNGHSLTPMSGPAMGATATTAAAAAAAATDETTQSETQLLAAGRFAEYHLAKAKRLLASGEAKEAAYQAGASLAHDRLPEAREVRRQALERSAATAA